MTVQYEGGYFMIPEPLVRGYGPNAHTAKDMTKLSGYTVEAVNHIQDTPWQINPMMFDLITRIAEEGANLTLTAHGEEEVILRVEEPVDPRSYDPIFDDMTKEVWEGLEAKAKQEFKSKRARALTRWEEELGEYRATQRILEMAREMAQFELFYFPHNLDFRTRIYPIPTDLTPQSNDLSKGLLRFARPCRLGKEGVFWMGFTVASQWGEDKLSPADRFRFASEETFFKQCEAWVDDPYTNRGWLKADSPFQFLAVAHEWVWAMRSSDPESFMSKLPGNLDGSCNGAQHLSIMSRDLVGATATNCRSAEKTGNKRFDLYMEVADRVWARVEQDAAQGEAVALEWVPKMMNPSDRRKVVKRAVMTVPYGVTEYGVAEFMIKDKHVERDRWDAAKYMRDLIMESIDATMAEGRKLQRWFQACAVKCAQAGLPLIWDTPAGSKVTQAYRNVIQKRIQSFSAKFYVYEEPTADEDEEDFLRRIGMDEKKMGTAAPPNVVHSCDASHLQITTCRMADAGIKDFSMIHDSFGCHFAHMSLMREILLQSIVDMYADNYLERWKESVERYSGLTMPEPPQLGQFDLNEILGSEFCFS
ncbi:DNA-directed RNA polymerase [Xinfangfangia sp. CPCC 101601]|uniref:DNA-directed RNA polymerase n=1 Tax=Pseudogemmobacter lacusdianii TaxID=3069608 RepID=A0ABU0VY77_9RHOB|nr:DNA-directed RNA polymerase [Xinfangfangia sp. CPCC 101601]MDQ2066710.1 DNA-directed RNA polymerase [Xinfangfangia sp. CPCC 101601]